MSRVLERIRGGLIVSVQAQAGSALDDPNVLAAIAKAAEDGGAVGVRIQGVGNLRAARKRVCVPIVGLIKRSYAGFEPYITPTMREARAVISTGAEIVAFDATWRPHPSEGHGLEEAVAQMHAAGVLTMADCAQERDAESAFAAGVDIIATTLCGYTAETAGTPLPALDLVRKLTGAGRFVVCEGGVHSPAQARAAIEAGASAVVVGTAITNIEWVTRGYVEAVGTPQRSSRPSNGVN